MPAAAATSPASMTEDEQRRAAILSRLYGAPAPTGPTPLRPAPVPIPPVSPPPAAPVPAQARPAPAPAVAPVPVRPAATEWESAEPAPLEPELPLGERLRLLLTEQNVRILFNIGLSILFGGLAIFIRIYWNEYSRFQQLAYLGGGTAAAGIAGFLLRRTRFLQTSGNYLLVATGICVPLDVYAWTTADILPAAHGRAIGLLTSGCCLGLYAGMLGWLRERILAYLTVLALMASYLYALTFAGVEPARLVCWMPLLFVGMTVALGRTTPPAEPTNDAPPATAGPPETEWSLLAPPARLAALAGTPVALLVAFFQALLQPEMSGPAAFWSIQLLLQTACAHAILIRVGTGVAEVLWPAAFVHAIAIGLALHRWLPWADWGPWTMAGGALGMGALVSARPRIGAPSALPYLILCYLMMGGALALSAGNFLLAPDAAHAGRLMATLAWPTAACIALALRPESERYTQRAVVLLYVEALLALVLPGWTWPVMLAAAAGISAAFLAVAEVPATGRFQAWKHEFGRIGVIGAALGMAGSLAAYFATILESPGDALLVAAAYGALAAIGAGARRDERLTALAGIYALGVLTAWLRLRQTAWTEVSLWQAGLATVFAAAGFAPAEWASRGVRTASLACAGAAFALFGQSYLDTGGIDHDRLSRLLAVTGAAAAVLAARARRAAAPDALGFEFAALTLFTLGFRSFLVQRGVPLAAQMTWLALPSALWMAVPSALAGLTSRPYREAGPAISMLTALVALAVTTLTATFYLSAERPAATVFTLVYGVLFAVGSRLKNPEPSLDAQRPLLAWPATVLLGAALVYAALWGGVPVHGLSILLAALGAAYLAVSRGVRRLPDQPFLAPLGACAVVALWAGFLLSILDYAILGNIGHAAAALGGALVVATFLACALLKEPPLFPDGKPFAAAAAVCFAYPYVATAWALFSDPALRVLAAAGLSGIYTAVERRTRGTSLDLLAAPCAGLNVLALLFLNVVGAAYAVQVGDARLASLATGVTAGILTYYAFAAAAPIAFPPVVSAAGSALLFTVSYALLLFHYSTGSNKGGLAFLGSTFVLGIVALALRHRQRSPQWQPYFGVALLNSAIAILLALPHPSVRAWVLFGLSLLYGGFGSVLEVRFFTYLACIALSGGYVSLLQTMAGVQSKHMMYWMLALALGKTVAGGYLAKQQEQRAEAGAPAARRPLHPAFHVGIGLTFLSFGLMLTNAPLYFQMEYWLSIGAAWVCGVIFLLAWLVSRQDTYLYLSALTVVGSYFVWLQNHDLSSWEWYTLPIGILGLAWARTLGARKLDAEQTRTVDVLALLATLLPSVLQSLSSLRTANAALAFVLATAVTVLGMMLKRKLYLTAGVLGVVVELGIQLVHLIDFSGFGPVHYFIFVGAVIVALAMVLSYFVSKQMQAKANEARARIRTFFAEWE